MLETLQSLILDFHEAPLETGVPRRLDIRSLPGKATVCIGVRRSGKSTLLLQTVQRLLDQGVPRTSILFLNFFDDRIRSLNGENLAVVADAYYSLFPEKKGSETVYCFFDEIQEVPGWEPFVERMMRTEKCEVWLTGSSARLLSREVATRMRGRALSWEIFPFSFREFLDWKGVRAKGVLSTKERMLAMNAFSEYWESGGFPEVLGLERRLRVKIHQEYVDAILFRDLIERYDISHPKALTDLAHRLMENAASLYSVNSLAGYLKSLGHSAPKSAVSQYLEWFEDAFFLFTVRLFDPSLARSNANPKKIYCVDHAVIPSVSSGILVNSGHLLENLVFLSLRRRIPEIRYYRTKSGKEVDFIARAESGGWILVQVCESLADEQTRRREIDALAEAMVERSTQTGFIVTRSESEQIETSFGSIEVLPAWKFLLDQSGADVAE